MATTVAADGRAGSAVGGSAAAPRAADEQTIRREAAAFAKRELSDDVSARDRAGSFSRDAWLACAQFGVQGLAVPAEFGGAAASLRTTMATMEGLGLGCEDNGLLFSLNAQIWSVETPIVHFGSEEQKKRYLPGFCSGELIGAHGMTEPNSGSDAFSLETRAVRSGANYVINGRKTFITNAPVADVAVVFATVDASLGVSGVTAFIVDRDTRGFSVESPTEKMGLRTSPMADLVFDDCVVPATRRLGGEGSGATIFNSSMEWERAAILSACVGSMERELQRCATYANERKQFGKSIGGFPAVAARLADMKVRLEASRGLLERVADRKDAGESAHLEAAIAKLFVSEAWVQSCLDAQQVYGAYGYVQENPIERQLRDALAARIYSGTSDIQRMVIARWLGVRAG